MGGELHGARILALVLFGLILYGPGAYAQSGPQGVGRELALWTGGGHGINGSTSDTGVWNVGGRYGWVLTNPAGPRFLRGRFEYAVDVAPIFWVIQRTGIAYGFGLNPFELKWNFETHHKAAPYLSISGGTLFTNRQVPAGTSRVNFTSSGGLGMYILRGKHNWSIEVLFMHISNAGLSAPNPGINTVQARIGLGRFRPPK